MKNKTIISVLLTLISVSLLVYTYKKLTKKNISEISVIDYRNELTIIDNKSILEFENFNFLKSAYNKENIVLNCNNSIYFDTLFFIKSISSIVNQEIKINQCGNFSFYYNEKDDLKWYSIIDELNEVFYDLNINENSSIYSFSITNRNRDLSPRNFFIDNVLSNILSEDNITIKKTDRDVQLIIKELDEAIIIYRVQGTFDLPYGILIEVYKK
jgi:hypothetical protein